MQYATRLNSLKSRPELFFSGEITTLELLRRAQQIRGLNSLSLNFPEHFTPQTLGQVHSFLEEAGLGLDSLNIRFPAQPFADGAFTNPDRAIRQQAVNLVQQAMDACVALGGKDIIVWPGYDGYDYPFQGDYARMFNWTVEAFSSLAAHNRDVQVGIEYKPWEPRKNSLLANMGEALYAVELINAPNVGVVLDYCHALMAHEHPPKAAALALSRGKLFGVHLNDGYGRQDDGLMVASNTLLSTLELMTVLVRGGYSGSLYFDTFPVREDPVRECEWNIRICEKLLARAAEVVEQEPDITALDPFRFTRVIDLLLGEEVKHG